VPEDVETRQRNVETFFKRRGETGVAREGGDSRERIFFTII
jgi:hypothetical protein